MKGKLIIIEGIDGSGKATQTKKLVERLRQEGKQVETFSFPRHGQEFFGKLVDRYLNNEFGDAAELDPHIASVFYACDRWEAKDMILGWLGSGKTVVLDRYATSNMGHQLSKIKNTKEKEEFLAWLDKMEFEVFKIPRPDKVIYIRVAVEKVIELIKKRAQKEYIDGRKDGLESNRKHLETTAETYQWICQKYNYWEKVECMKNRELLTVEEIHEKIWEKIKN